MQLEILSWIYGVGAMLSLALAYQQQKRKKMIFFKLCADVCWVVHYVCLGAFSGAVPNFIGIFRELVFIRRGHKKWADSSAWLILFIVLNFVLGFFALQSPVCLLPVCASVFVTVSLWLKNPTYTKLVLVPVSAAFLIYDIFVGSWLGVCNESASIASVFFYFLKNYIMKRKAGKK